MTQKSNERLLKLRIEELEERVKYHEDTKKELHRKNERYREALKFYADESNYVENYETLYNPRTKEFNRQSIGEPIVNDKGEIARVILKEETK